MANDYRDYYLGQVMNNDSWFNRGQNPNLDIGAWLAAGRSGGGGGSNLTGSAHPNPTPYGQVPNVPNPATSAAQAVAANQANMAALQALYAQLNTFNAGQAANQYRMNFPNYDALTKQRSNVIGQELAGQVPQDTIDLLIQQAAERGIATGSPGSPNTNAAYMKAFYDTSNNQRRLGMQDYTGAYQTTPTAPISDPSRMFITPDAIQQAQMAANLYASAPDPALAAAEARRYGGYNAPSYGGFNSNIAPVRLTGGGSAGPYQNPEPQYGTYAAGQTGPTYNYQDPSRYAAWNSWASGQGWNQPDFEEDFWNANNVADTSYKYDPILDVGINPASLSGGGGWYNFGGGDGGLGF